MPSPSLSTDEFCCKIQKLASRHEQMKIAYHDLKSQINAGLLEAEEVFSSLAIPLMKLVGLKTEEMAEEGRFSTIVIDNGYSHGLESQSSDASRGGEQDYRTAASEGENYATRATVAGRELVQKQHENLSQLIHLLRQIENHVNCQQDGILENLEKHRLYLHKYFRKAISYIFALRSQNKDTSFTTQKLLQDIFDNVNAVLGSLESGVNSLIQGLAEKMCNPMAEYVKGVRDDMKGTSVQFLHMFKELEQTIRSGKLELEDAKKKVRVAEEEKIKALCKLKTIEDKVKRTKKQFSLPAPQRKCVDSSGQGASHKFFAMEEEQIKDDKLLWNLLNNKRKSNATSPMGPEGLPQFNTNNKRCVRPSLEHTRITRSRAKTHNLQNIMLKY